MMALIGPALMELLLKVTYLGFCNGDLLANFNAALRLWKSLDAEPKSATGNPLAHVDFETLVVIFI